MLRNALELFASLTQARFARYRSARLAYEQYLRRLGKPLFKITAADQEAARKDSGLAAAESDYREALRLTLEEGDLRDAALAYGQLGQLYLLQGRTEEAVAQYR